MMPKETPMPAEDAPAVAPRTDPSRTVLQAFVLLPLVFAEAMVFLQVGIEQHGMWTGLIVAGWLAAGVLMVLVLLMLTLDLQDIQQRIHERETFLNEH